MRFPLRSSLIAAAVVAIGGFEAAGDGCTSKPPQPDLTIAAPYAPKPGPAPTGTDAVAGVAKTASPSSSSLRATTGGAATADSASGSAIPVDRTQTSDERRAALDKRLDDSLGTFDAQLRKEQERIARERDARQTTVTTVPAVDGGSKPAPDESGETAEDTAEPPSKRSASHRGAESGSARRGDLKSDKSTGGANGNVSGNGAVAEEIPDGNDDDVVARRLRKAAEQETDPELKDKLWKEYVEYKKNTQGR